jgi:hypothetical protein
MTARLQAVIPMDFYGNMIKVIYYLVLEILCSTQYNITKDKEYGTGSGH